MGDRYLTLLSDLPEPDRRAAELVRQRAARVLRPAGALSRLDDVAVWLAGWMRSETPRVARPGCAVFVADHGVAARGVSAYPAHITAEMLRALSSGVATAAAMARSLDVHLEVVDVGVGEPTGDITVEDALTHEGFERCFEAGRATVRSMDADLLIFGEMGIANTTPAAAVAAGLFGLAADDWTGRGTGVDADGLARKIEAVESARRRVEGCSPLEVLRRAGGSELVAMAGACLEARLRSTPVILDGFVVTAAVSALGAAAPSALDHCIAGHLSPEPGHRLLLEKLAMEPLLDLDLRLGEGSGALAALPLVKLAAACVTDVATFEEWGL